MTSEPIDKRIISEAEALTGVRLTPEERSQAAEKLPELLAIFERRRSLLLPNGLAPAVGLNLAGIVGAETTRRDFDTRPPDPAIDPSTTGTSTVPKIASGGSDTGSSADIAFAPLQVQAAWLRSGGITSEKLTRIYLDRLRKHGPTLNCVATLTEDRALEQSKRADREIAAGRFRSILHGIPWGAKDLLDTAGISTEWGAEPYAGRTPTTDAEVVRRLDAAGAVLVAKLSLGSLAYGDIWSRGRTNNPWNPAEGSSGSSAGSASAVAAGLVSFAIGTETMGSIISPSLRCGTVGLRPTFGRVPRTGAMALCWTFDKIGPICRTSGDAFAVLSAIHGPDGHDFDAQNRPLRWVETFRAATTHPTAGRELAGLRIGFDPAWYSAANVAPAQRAVLDVMSSLGAELQTLTFPVLPYDSLSLLVYVEAAAAFEDLSLGDLDELLAWQGTEAWPNTFRVSRFIPAVEYVQAQRFRRQLSNMMESIFAEVDVIVSPGTDDPMLVITNGTGHPSLTIRAGFEERAPAPDIGSAEAAPSGSGVRVRVPCGVTLYGRMWDEGLLCSAGRELEQKLGVFQERPPLLEASNG